MPKLCRGRHFLSDLSHQAGSEPVRSDKLATFAQFAGTARLPARSADATGIGLAGRRCTTIFDRMYAANLPAGPRAPLPVGKSHHIEIDDEALVINGIRFETNPKPHEITKALGTTAAEFSSFGYEKDWTSWVWHEAGIVAFTESHLVTELHILLHHERLKLSLPPTNFEDYLSRNREEEIRNLYTGTVSLWGTAFTANTPREEIERFKPGPSLKIRDWGDGRVSYSSSYGESVYGTSQTGGRSICIDTSKGAFQGIRFAWPSLSSAKRVRRHFSLAADERLIMLCDTYGFPAPRRLNRIVGLLSGNLSGYSTNRSISAPQPILCITDRRLLAKSAEGIVEQWSLGDVLGARIITEVPPEKLSDYPASRRERAADQLQAKHTGKRGWCDAFRNAQVLTVTLADQSQAVFPYRCTESESYTARLLEDFVAQLTTAIARYGATAPPITTVNGSPVDDDHLEIRAVPQTGLVDCPHCGAPVATDADRCPQCRGSIAVALKKCSKCGSPVSPYSRDCPNPGCRHQIVPLGLRETRCSIDGTRISKFAINCPTCMHPNTWNQKAGLVTLVLLIATGALQAFDLLANGNALFPLPILAIGFALALRVALVIVRKWYPSPR
jgi:hypothetical protein